MSRIGKKVISIPDGVVFSFDDDAIVNTVKVKGSLGEISKTFIPQVHFSVNGSELSVSVENTDDDFQNAMWGTARSVVNNMVEGVSKGFTKKLELNGVGFRMELGAELVLHIGFSHPVKVKIPNEVKLSVSKNVLTGTSHDKELLGNFFSQVFNLKPCDVYKHKGFKFPGVFYRRKVGKKGK